MASPVSVTSYLLKIFSIYLQQAVTIVLFAAPGEDLALEWIFCLEYPSGSMRSYLIKYESPSEVPNNFPTKSL